MRYKFRNIFLVGGEFTRRRRTAALADYPWAILYRTRMMLLALFIAGCGGVLLWRRRRRLRVY